MTYRVAQVNTMSRPLAPRPLAFFRSLGSVVGSIPTIGCEASIGRVGDVWTGIRSLATGYRGPLKT